MALNYLKWPLIYLLLMNATITIALIARETSPSVSENTLTIPALGRGARLGGLYDSRTSQFLGLNMFSSDPFSNFTQLVSITEIPETNMVFHIADSLQDKMDKLGVEARVAVDIQSGKIKIEGSAKYLSQEKKSSRHVEGFLYYKSRTKKEYLNVWYKDMDNYISQDSLNRLNATHVIVAVEYGGDVYAQFTDRNENGESTTDISGSFHLALKTSQLNLEAQAKAEILNKNVNQIRNYTVQIYGDVTGTDVPQDFESVLKFIKQVPMLLNATNGGRGKPMVYTLMPLEALKEKHKLAWINLQLERQIDSSTYTQFVQIFDRMTRTQQELNDMKELMLKNFISVPDPDYTRLESLKNSYETTSTDFKAKIKDTLKLVRTGEVGTSELDRIQSEYFRHTFSAGIVSSQLDDKFGIIRGKIKLYTSLKKFNVIYLGRYDNLVAELLKHTKKLVHVLLYSPHLVSQNVKAWNQNLHIFSSYTKLHRPFSQLIVVDCDFGIPQCQDLNQTVVRQYYGQSLLSADTYGNLERQISNLNSNSNLNSDGFKRIYLPGLGQIYRVGQLYDSSTEEFMEASILKGANHNQNHSSIIQIENLWDKLTPVTPVTHSFSPFSLDKLFKSLDIPPALSVGLMTRHFKTGGEWKATDIFRAGFLPTNVNRLMGACVSVKKTKLEKLVLTDEKLLETVAIEDLNDGGRAGVGTKNATHFISKIIYGSTAILYLQQRMSVEGFEIGRGSGWGSGNGEEDYYEDEVETRQEKFNLILKRIENLYLNGPPPVSEKQSKIGTNGREGTSPSTTGAGSVLKNSSDEKSLLELEVSTFSDVNRGQVNPSQSFEDENDLINYLVKSLAQSGVSDHVIPLIYILEPLDTLHNFSLVIPPRGNFDILQRDGKIWKNFDSFYDQLINSLEILSQFKIKCGLDYNKKGLLAKDVGNLTKFVREFQSRANDWKNQVSDLYEKFKLNQISESHVKELAGKFVEFKLSPNLLTQSMQIELGHVIKKLEIVKLMRGHHIHYLGQGDHDPNGNVEDKVIGKGVNKIIYLLMSSRRDRQDGVGVGEWTDNTKYFFNSLKKPFNQLYFVDCDFNFNICDPGAGSKIQQYYGGQHLSSNLLQDLKTQTKGQNQRIEIPALGQNFKLGQLYDVTKGSFLTRSILHVNVQNPDFVTHKLGHDETINENFRNSGSPCFMKDTISSRFERLQVPPQISLGILTENNIPTGQWKFAPALEMKPGGMERYRAMCIQRKIRGVKGIEFNDNFLNVISFDKLQEGLRDGSRATHYIKKIVFGSTSILSLHQSLNSPPGSKLENLMKNKMDLESNFKTLQFLFTNLDMSNSNSKSDEPETPAPQDINFTPNVTLKYFSDLPYTKELASLQTDIIKGHDWKNIDKLSHLLVKASDPNGVPLTYILEPLETLRPFTILLSTRPTNTFFPNSTIISHTYDLYDKLYESQVKVNHFMRSRRSQDSQQCLTEGDNKQLQDFQDQFNHNVSAWKTLGNAIYWKFQTNQNEAEASYRELVHKFKGLQLAPNDLEISLVSKFRHVTEKLGVIRVMMKANIPIIGRDGEEKLGQLYKEDDPIYFLLSRRQWRQLNPKGWPINAKFFLTVLKKQYNKLIFIDCDFNLTPCSKVNDTQIDLYQKGQLTFSKVYQHFEKTTHEVVLEIKALGRLAAIGDLYDATQGNFVPEGSARSVFKSKLKIPGVQRVPIYKTGTENDLLSSLKGTPLVTYGKLFETLDIKPQEQIGILLNKFKLDRHAGFFKFLKKPKDILSTLHVWINATGPIEMEELDLDKFGDFGHLISGLGLNSNIQNGATHVVQKVEYGSINIVTCQSKNDNDNCGPTQPKILDNLQQLLKLALGDPSFIDKQNSLFTNVTLDYFLDHTIINSTKQDEFTERSLTLKPLTYVLIPLHKLQRPLGFVSQNNDYGHITMATPGVNHGLSTLSDLTLIQNYIDSLETTLMTKIENILDSNLATINSLKNQTKSSLEEFKLLFDKFIQGVMSGQRGQENGNGNTEIQTKTDQKFLLKQINEFKVSLNIGGSVKIGKDEILKTIKAKFDPTLSKIRHLERMAQVGMENGRPIEFLAGKHKNLSDIFMKNDSRTAYVLFYREDWVLNKPTSWMENLSFFFSSSETSQGRLVIIDCEFPVSGCESQTESSIHSYNGGKLSTNNLRLEIEKNEQVISHKIIELKNSFEILNSSFVEHTHIFNNSFTNLTEIGKMTKKDIAEIQTTLNDAAFASSEDIKDKINNLNETFINTNKSLTTNIETVTLNVNHLQLTEITTTTIVNGVKDTSDKLLMELTDLKKKVLGNKASIQTTSKNDRTDWEKKIEDSETRIMKKVQTVELGNVERDQKITKLKLSSKKQNTKVWPFRNFTNKTVGRLSSEPITIQGYTFKLHLYPGGADMKQSHMSIFYERINGSYDVILRPLYDVPIRWTLYSQNVEGSPEKQESRHQKTELVAPGFDCESLQKIQPKKDSLSDNNFGKLCGTKEFISWGDLWDMDKKYVDNGTIFIGVELGFNLPTNSELDQTKRT